MQRGVFRLKELSPGGPSCSPVHVLCLLQDGALLLSGAHPRSITSYLSDFSELGAGDCLKIWNASSWTLTQTFWLGEKVLASIQANLGDNQAGVFVGASDGSVSLFEIKKVSFLIIYNGYVADRVSFVPGKVKP